MLSINFCITLWFYKYNHETKFSKFLCIKHVVSKGEQFLFTLDCEDFVSESEKLPNSDE